MRRQIKKLHDQRRSVLEGNQEEKSAKKNQNHNRIYDHDRRQFEKKKDEEGRKKEEGRKRRKDSTHFPIHAGSGGLTGSWGEMTGGRVEDLSQDSNAPTTSHTLTSMAHLSHTLNLILQNQEEN